MFAINVWEVKKINYFHSCSTMSKLRQKNFETFFLGYIAEILPKTATINPALEIIVVIRPITRYIHTYKQIDRQSPIFLLATKDYL